MGNRFVVPESVRLPISAGDFIDVKNRLNHGELEDLHARWAPFVTPGEPLQLNRREVRTAKVLTYLIGWSLTDPAGAPVPMAPDLPEAVRVANLRSLDPESFSEIFDAIVTHEAATTAARAAEKKTATGTPGSDVTSRSPSAAAGDYPTSVN